MANCDNCKCNSNDHLLDILSFTLQDLGVEHLEGIPDQELLELVNRKIRMLYQMCVTAGVDEDILQIAMNG